MPAAAAMQTASGVAATLPEPPAAPADRAPHIALILPLNSPTFARAADAVRQGFLASAQVQQGLPVRVYASNDEPKEFVELYRKAIGDGAVAVAGPLTRNAVAALVSYPDISVPTLALNFADTYLSGSNLYFFGLPAENEARRVAQLAAEAGLHDATIISTDTPIAKRLAAAFADEWGKLGGSITAEVKFSGDFSVLNKLPVAPWPPGQEPKPASAVSATGEPIASNRPFIPPVAPGNMAFLATEHKAARLIRPYLNPTLPVYATSLLFTGNDKTLDNFDLNDVHFVDMPWLLQPDHPAVMIFPRANPPLSPEMDRLYALGIDAYRIVYVLLTNGKLPLDGVTGSIEFDRQQFLREPIPAFFRQGLGLTKETLAALNAAKAAAEAAAKQQAENASAPVATEK